MYGVPGSGKSHEIKTKYCNDEKMMERVVLSDYTYSDFVGQILPRVEKDKDGNEKLKYVFTPGPFTRMLKKAQEIPELLLSCYRRIKSWQCTCNIWRDISVTGSKR